jgi:hypothetical protein
MNMAIVRLFYYNYFLQSNEQYNLPLKYECCLEKKTKNEKYAGLCFTQLGALI